MTLEEHINTLEDLDTSQDEKLAEAVETASEALAFAQSLWNTFHDMGYRVDTDFDFNTLMSVIEAINNELAAAVLLLSAMPNGAGVSMLEDTAQKAAKDLKNHPDPVAVSTMLNSFHTLADKVRTSQQFLDRQLLDKQYKKDSQLS